jgi:hypothetical protein
MESLLKMALKVLPEFQWFLELLAKNKTHRWHFQENNITYIGGPNFKF